MTDYSEILIIEDLVKHRGFGHKEGCLVSGAGTHLFVDCVDYVNNASHLGRLPSQGRPHGHGTCAAIGKRLLRKLPHLVSCSATIVLQFLLIFKKEELRFHSALVSANYVAHSNSRSMSCWRGLTIFSYFDRDPLHQLMQI